MDFRTEIIVPKQPLSVSYQSNILMLGSCFAENIGQRLLANNFKTNLNPFGILYNPASISQALFYALSNQNFTSKDIFQHQGVFHSFMHHGDFSNLKEEDCLHTINDSLRSLRLQMKTLDVVFVTFGTSFVFEHRDSQKVVSNCHKLPASSFNRYRLSVDGIVDDWRNLISRFREVNPQIKFVFTVSPIRHWADGAHENQLSKSTLLLAIDKLQTSASEVSYFPAYELLLDDLRDYRFYAKDMLHPNDVAVEYIWSKFGDAFFEEDTMLIISEWTKIRKSIEHKSFNSDSEEHQRFLKQTLLKLDQFKNKYPYFDCAEERLSLLNRLSPK